MVETLDWIRRFYLWIRRCLPGRHSRESGNPESRQKPSAFPHRQDPTHPPRFNNTPPRASENPEASGEAVIPAQQVPTHAPRFNNTPLIHEENGNVYRPGESLELLFEDAVLRPLRAQLPDLAGNLGRPDINRRVRENVLGRGRTDFCQSYEGSSPLDGAPVCYSPEQKALLYCAVNMPMHLYSSYHVYQRHLEPPEGKVLFIDFGCGPLTSGIAYHAFAKKHANVSYIGIDRSRAMLDMVRSIYDASLFNRCMPLDNFSSLPHCIDKFIMDNQTIIFNFCYILAIRTLGGFSEFESPDKCVIAYSEAV